MQKGDASDHGRHRGAAGNHLLDHGRPARAGEDRHRRENGEVHQRVAAATSAAAAAADGGGSGGFPLQSGVTRVDDLSRLTRERERELTDTTRKNF